MEWMTPPYRNRGVDTVPMRFVCVHHRGLYSRLSSIDCKSQFLQEDHVLLCSLYDHEYVARLQGKHYSLEFRWIADPSG